MTIPKRRFFAANLPVETTTPPSINKTSLKIHILQSFWIGLWGAKETWRQTNVKTTLPETNSSPLKMVVSNRNLLFQGSIFRGYVSFREGKCTFWKDPTASIHPRFMSDTTPTWLSVCWGKRNMTIFALTAKQCSSHFGSIIRPHVCAVLCHHWFVCSWYLLDSSAMPHPSPPKRCGTDASTVTTSAASAVTITSISHGRKPCWNMLESVICWANNCSKPEASCHFLLRFQENLQRPWKILVGDRSRRTLPGHFDPFFDLGGSPMHGKQLQKSSFSALKRGYMYPINTHVISGVYGVDWGYHPKVKKEHHFP